MVGWLRDRESLTRRILSVCPLDFRVRVIDQRWAVPLAGERSLLKMQRRETAWVREVELFCRDEPWVFARTVVPARSLKGGSRRLKSLGEKPLGALLFADRSLRRGNVEIGRISARDPLVKSALGNQVELPPELWGRRTVFLLGGKPLLVSEVFLPGIPAAKFVAYP